MFILLCVRVGLGVLSDFKIVNSFEIENLIFIF